MNVVKEAISDVACLCGMYIGARIIQKAGPKVREKRINNILKWGSDAANALAWARGWDGELWPLAVEKYRNEVTRQAACEGLTD